MRRTRALLALGDVLGPGAKLIDRKLRRRVRALSTLRDAHALVETLDRLLDRPCDDDTKRRLARARRAAAHARAALIKGQDVTGNLADTHSLLVMLRAALLGLPWDQIDRSMLEAALAATSHDIDSARERVRRSGRDADWHRWRRRMRRLSQQHRACAAAGVEFTASMFDKSLAEQLGVMQDLTLLLEHCGSGTPVLGTGCRCLASIRPNSAVPATQARDLRGKPGGHFLNPPHGVARILRRPVVDIRRWGNQTSPGTVTSTRAAASWPHDDRILVRNLPLPPVRAGLQAARKPQRRRGRGPGRLAALAPGRPLRHPRRRSLAGNRHHPPRYRPPAPGPDRTRRLHRPMAAGAAQRRRIAHPRARRRDRRTGIPRLPLNAGAAGTGGTRRVPAQGGLRLRLRTGRRTHRSQRSQLPADGASRAACACRGSVRASR